jgi:3-deoxy-manno-octulosonate cytidylyltransferase (CMP-KDO synthetase)
VIPARWASSRFPGKVLAPLAGQPLILHVVRRVTEAEEVAGALVATDDVRVIEVVRQAGYDAVLTRSDHASGSDRIAEAMAGRDAEFILNVQGDEPLVDPGALDRLVGLLRVSDAGAATLAVPVDDPLVAADENVVKVVCDLQGYALYFSRAAIPGTHPTHDGRSGWLRHLGVYAWRRESLEQFVSCEPTPLERREGLEQLRFLEHGGRMRVEVVRSALPGVDTREDLARCEALLAESGGPV